MKRRSALVVIAALLLLVGAASCSDDSDDGAQGGGAASVGAGDSDDASAAAAAIAEGLDEDGGRPFGVSREDVGHALATATKAERFEVDGNVLRLIYAEGSKDDSTASINCSVASGMIGDDDEAIAVYPDGELDCTDRAEGGS